jgi:thiol-disulfide isomerase/thioredoxin
MSRNTIYGLVALVAIAAGTMLWRYHEQSGVGARGERIAKLLENTEGLPHERVRVLDSLAGAHPDDELVQRIAAYQILTTLSETDTDSLTLVDAVDRFLATDSSGAAYNFASSVYADAEISVREGLIYAESALLEANTAVQPEGMTPEQWAGQRRMMVGECKHIHGRLLALDGQTEKAAVALSAAADSVPDSPLVLLNLARNTERLGQRRLALDRYMAVVRLKYDDSYAREAVGRLHPALRSRYASAHGVLDTLVSNARLARRAAVLADTVRRPMPTISLDGPDDTRHASADLLGKVVVVDLWATWCAPCLKQMPELERAYQRYLGHPGVEFLAISFDERREAVVPFMQRNGYSFPVAYGDRTLYEDFRVQGIPTTYIVDRDGTIRFERLGYSEVGDFAEELSWRIEALLGEASPL